MFSILFTLTWPLAVLTATNFDPVSVIHENCQVQEKAQLPFSEDDPLPAEMNASLIIDRFIGIDDVLQTASIIGVFTLAWSSNCVKKVAEENWPNRYFTIDRMGFEDFWSPYYLHRNAIEDMAIGEDGFVKNLIVIPLDGVFIKTHSGRFESYCDLDFYRFPFDSQKCSMIVTMVTSDAFVRVESAACSMSNQTNQENLIWQLTHYGAQIIRTFPVNLKNNGSQVYSSEMHFKLRVQRQPEYYMINFFIPNLILGILQVSSFLIQADSSDRPTFSCTLLLSVFIIQDHIIAVLPITAALTLAFLYILFSTVFAMGITIYGGLMCYFITYFPSVAKRRYRLMSCGGRGYRLYRIVDLIVFILTAALFIAYNYIFFELATVDEKIDQSFFE